MSKRAKGWLIAAGALVMAGCIIFCGVMIALKWDFSKLGTVKWVTTTHVIDEAFDDISMLVDTADVTILPAKDGVCKVVFREKANEPHTVAVADGALTIRENADKKPWYRYLQISLGHSNIMVYLPEETYRALTLEGDTGDVALPNALSFETVDIAVSTGDVTLTANVTGALHVKASTGDITVRDMTAGSMALTVSTGHIRAQSATCAGEMSVAVSTGNVQLTDATCGELNSTGSTGDLTMTNVIAAETVSIRRSTGDVTLNGCDAAELAIKTSTGDVTGRLLSDKIFFATTSTGDVDVPAGTVGGRCEVTTSTGNINLTVAK